MADTFLFFGLLIFSVCEISGFVKVNIFFVYFLAFIQKIKFNIKKKEKKK
jgi:uncharacterized membrane protein